ncbi:paraquat-inducible protein A [Accumulibacter sp.]|uniref:paraquat-inducible protein A n=1 Tax=Accumulibacter sp. TaxID=2053492 RepID=UPI0025CB92A3|nr:paraquat-inducible protein A [Accumulibacter sp.]MCM8611940.1 paraquat-inducible protein A [Accumulibacter sp.]MCM8635562.1 paraquat-inducible protein A [Accumulibacter sp.]MCM8639140.1 paraquat-inducible protein A [Accumulibacter sp.]
MMASDSLPVAAQVPAASAAEETLLACPDCDLLQRLPPLPPHHAASCARCQAPLCRHKPDSLERTLALALAAAILLLIANVVPMLGLSVAGREAFTTVLGGVVEMWREGSQVVAMLVLFAAVIAPALEIVCLLLVVLAVRHPPAPHWVATLLHGYEFVREWSMIEIMLLGVLVALIKIAELATVIPGLALFVLGSLVFLLAAMAAAFDPRVAWQRIEWAAGRGPDGIAGGRG